MPCEAHSSALGCLSSAVKLGVFSGVDVVGEGQRGRGAEGQKF